MAVQNAATDYVFSVTHLDAEQAADRLREAIEEAFPGSRAAVRAADGETFEVVSTIPDRYQVELPTFLYVDEADAGAKLIASSPPIPESWNRRAA